MGDYQQLPNEDEVDDRSRDAEATPPPKRKELFGYPTQVYFILGNEFCERFSYYGMHAILVIYLMSMLKMNKDDATAVYHAFNMLCYFSPIFGAIIADSFWGKYKTILYISLIYALGNVVVSFTAVPSVLSSVQLYGPAIGLVLIAIGTGGIKPCVSAFGGDQFESGQEEKLQSFFSIFYFAINCGSLIATLLTPVLRADVKCFGYDCYPLAFGVPAILMILSLILFVFGSSLYKKVPPEGNVVVQVSSAVGNAIKNRISHCGSGIKKDHWIDWASDRYNPILKSDIKALFKVLFMFLPLPVFWTLFDQQGSRWTLQAIEMNGDIGWFGLTIKPDQMQALNPVFVMILIPFAEAVVYPLLKLCGVLTKPLQRMGAGMGLVALSFVVAGYLQMKMEAISTVATLPATGFANYRVINTVPCDIGVFSEDFKTKNLTIPYQHGTEYFSVPTKLKHISINSQCPPKMNLDEDVKVEEKLSYTLVIGANHSRLATTQLEDDVTPFGHTRSKVRFLHAGGSVTDAITIKLNRTLIINLTPFSNPEYISIISKSYHVRATANGTADALALKRIIFGKGGIYTVVIQPNRKLDGLQFFVYEDVSPRPINILWQIPQYIIITLGEVMFSITGLEFAYSQSPPSMKSCIMAAWLLTVSVGNLLVVILAGVKLTEDMAKEFFFFAGLLGVVTVIFAIMAWFYKYVNYGCSRSLDETSYDDDDTLPLLPKSDPDVPSMKIHRPVTKEVVQEQSEIAKAGLEENNTPDMYGKVENAAQASVGQQQVAAPAEQSAAAALDSQQSAGLVNKYDMSSDARMQSLQGKTFTARSTVTQQTPTGYNIVEKEIQTQVPAHPSDKQYQMVSSDMALGNFENKGQTTVIGGVQEVEKAGMYIVTQGDLGTQSTLRQRHVTSEGSMSLGLTSGGHSHGHGHSPGHSHVHSPAHSVGLSPGHNYDYGHAGSPCKASGVFTVLESQTDRTPPGFGLVQGQSAHSPVHMQSQGGGVGSPGFIPSSTFGVGETQAVSMHSQTVGLVESIGTGYGLVESQSMHSGTENVIVGGHPSLAQEIASSTGEGYLIAERTTHPGYGLVEQELSHTLGVTEIESGAGGLAEQRIIQQQESVTAILPTMHIERIPEGAQH